jgi:acylphosphatase
MPALKRAAFRVHGHVQGVGFRWWCVRAANELGLDGTVRNVPDGSVEIHLSGEVFAVDQMTARLTRGPPLARVSNLEALPPRHIDCEGFRAIR